MYLKFWQAMLFLGVSGIFVWHVSTTTSYLNYKVYRQPTTEESEKIHLQIIEKHVEQQLESFLSGKLENIEQTLRELSNNAAKVLQNNDEIKSSEKLVLKLDQFMKEIKNLKSDTGNNSALGNENDSCKNDIPKDISGNGEWLKKLMPNYAKNIEGQLNLDHISMNVLRRSRSIVGNTERLHRILKGLVHEGKCLNIVIFGGSVSHGFSGDRNYHRQLREWLNNKYPCDGDGHVINKRGVKGGTGHPFAVSNFGNVFPVTDTETRVDLVLVEFGVNDSVLSNSKFPHSKDWEGAEMMENTLRYTELLIRKLLRRRQKGEQLAIIYLEASWRIYQTESAAEKPRLTNMNDMMRGFTAINGHHPVLVAYGIPTINLVDVFFELMTRTFEEKDSPGFNKDSFMVDKVHPSMRQHKLIATAIAYNLEEEMKWMESEYPDKERDLTLNDPPIMRKTLIASPSVDFQYQFTPNILDFFSQEPKPSYSKGFEWYADSKDKKGFIATKSGSFASFTYNVPNKMPHDEFGNPLIPKLELGFLSSYKGVSEFIMWTSQGDEKQQAEICREITYGPRFCSEFNCSCKVLSDMYGIYRAKYQIQTKDLTPSGDPHLEAMLRFWKYSDPRCHDKYYKPEKEIKPKPFTSYNDFIIRYKDKLPNFKLVNPINSKEMVSVLEKKEIPIPNSLGQVVSLNICALPFKWLAKGNETHYNPVEGDAKIKLLYTGIYDGSQ